MRCKLIFFNFLIPLLCFSMLVTGQQTRKITGTVKDPDNILLLGVSVQIKGTSKGVATDEKGAFSINVTNTENILVFTFVGMESQEVDVKEKTNLNIQLKPSSSTLSDVVVIGYGAVKKSDLTGAVTNVNITKLSELPNVSVVQALQGTVPGLNVGATDGVGSSPSMSVRGNNSLSTSDASPLIVVDGSIYRGSLIDINPSDIETIDILKDASSAAIYGSQASDGVIIITTKKGIGNGKPVVSYNGSYTAKTPSHQLVPMKSAEYEKFFRDAMWLNSRTGPDYLSENPAYDITQHFKSSDIREGYLAGQDNDWWGGLTRNGDLSMHNISVRGRSKDVNYFLSGGYTYDKGFVVNDNYKRFSYRINVDAKVNNWLSLGMESFLTSSDYSGAAPDADVAFGLQPFAPIYQADGQLQLFAGGTYLNPYAQLALQDNDKRKNISGNIHADVKLPLKGLDYRLNFSQNYRTSNDDRFNPHAENFTGSAYKNSGISYDWSVDNILTYKKTFGRIHNINATVVYGVEKRQGSSTNATGKQYLNGTLGFNSLQAGNPLLNSISSSAWQETSLYGMGRLIYNLKNRYLLTGTIRRDGFSGFGSNNKIGVFPSLAFGWVITEETFLKEKTNWLNYLKLRGSYGSTGSRGVNRYQTLAKVTSAPSYIFGENGPTSFGQYISSMANDQLGWEITTGVNAGFDFALFNSRLSGNVEYYNNNTNDILYNIQIPQLTGFSSIATNIGKVHNYGIEASLTGQIIKSKNLNWEATTVFSRNRNKIVSILGIGPNGKEQDIVANQLFIGQPQSVVYDYQIIGMWQLADQAAGRIPAGFFPGTEKIADLNKDGKYSAADDRKILGYRDPSYRMSLSNRVNYKNFSLYILINTVQGGKDFYWGDDSPFAYSGYQRLEQLKYTNVPAGAWDYWMPENPNAKYRRLDTPTGYAPRPYSQRNFIRLQDVSLAYTLDQNLTKKMDINSLKVFVSGKNLATITKWKGWDPETGRGLSSGVPLMTDFTFGLNVEF